MLVYINRILHELLFNISFREASLENVILASFVNFPEVSVSF